MIIITVCCRALNTWTSRCAPTSLATQDIVHGENYTSVSMTATVGDDHGYVNDNAQTSAASIRLAYSVKVALAIGSCASSARPMRT